MQASPIGYADPTIEVTPDGFYRIKEQCIANADYATMGHTRGFFEISWFLRGMDNFLSDLGKYDYAIVAINVHGATTKHN